MTLSRILSLVVCCAFSIGAYAQPSRPNVILIIADDLGYGDLSSYGQTKLSTPNIDRLASEGLRFTDHYSGNTVCSPSRAVLMTGISSGRLYIRGNLPGEAGAALDPARTVLPEIFGAAGYATGAFGKWGLGHTHVPGAPNPLTHGFDEFVGWKGQTIAHTYYPSTYVKNGEELPNPDRGYVHDLIMENAAAFVRKHAESGTPFFCYIPTAVPHAAMHAPKELHEKWRKVFPQFDDKIGKYRAGEEDCPDVQNPIAGFAAMMENLDNQIGGLLDMLVELEIDENTIVLFTSDNGPHREGGHDPEFWNSSGNLRGHKRDMHEGGIRVPLLARWPGTIAAGTTTDHISSFQDFVPTVAKLVGQPIPRDVDGLSLLPTLMGQPLAQPKHPFLMWEFTKGAEQRLFSQAVRAGEWKAYQEVGKPLELFNLRTDPYEQTDLAAERPEIVRLMRHRIEAGRVPLQQDM
ncbi:MAG: arylsulfatase [Synoicihabitans sp.]